MRKQDFADWLLNELGKRNWTQADLVRATGLTSGGVTHLLSRSRNPNPQTCQAIAKALGIPHETVFRAAGFLPTSPDIDEDYEELKLLFEGLSQKDQEELLAFGRFKIEQKAKQRGETREPKTQPRPANI